MKPSLVANLLPNKVMCVCFNIEYILIPEDFQNYAIDVCTIKRTSSHYFSYKVTYLVLDKTICQASLSATGCPPITMKMSTHKREKICRRSKSDAVAHFLLCGWLLAQLGKNIYEITYIVICTDFSWSDEHNILQINAQNMTINFLLNYMFSKCYF